MMEKSLATFASGARVAGSAKLAPMVAGVKFGIHMPLGRKRYAVRMGAFVAVAANADEAKRGSMASSSGSAMETPSPRSMVRREIGCLVIVVVSSQCITRALRVLHLI